MERALARSSTANGRAALGIVATAGQAMKHESRIQAMLRGGTRPITTLTFRTATIRDGAEIHVTGLWGCPSVPLVVKEAVIWTVRDWLREAQAVVDEAPDIEPGSAGPAGRGIPARAQMLLDKVYDWRVPE